MEIWHRSFLVLCIFLEMFVLSQEKRTLDDFRRWKVPELKEFLRIRGLKTTGTKDELTALAFGAEQLSVPVKLTAEEEIIQKKRQYQSLLNVNGEQLPDPFTELKDNWISAGADPGFFLGGGALVS